MWQGTGTVEREGLQGRSVQTNMSRGSYYDQKALQTERDSRRGLGIGALLIAERQLH
jgi:hypothetical protein